MWTAMLLALFLSFASRNVRATLAPYQFVFKDGEDGYEVFRIPALIRTPNSTLLVFAEARMQGADFDHIDLVLKRSTDNGKTWGAMSIVAGSKDRSIKTDHGQPTPVYDAQTGKVVLVWCLNNSDVFVTTSADEGVTWSESRNITSMVKRPGWGWMATGPNHALQLKTGPKRNRLVIPFNTFFEASEVVMRTQQTGCAATRECSLYFDTSQKTLSTNVEITNPKDPSMPPLRFTRNGTNTLPPYVWAGDRSGIFFSDDHGETWQLGGMIDSRIGSSECVVEEVADGLLLSFRVEDKDTGCRKMALSRDAGFTFEPFFEPEICIPDPVCQESMVKLRDGRLVHFGPGSSAERVNMTLFISEGSSQQDQLKFQKVALLANGTGGYSDVVELGPDSKTNLRQVGLVYCFDFGGGIVWAVTTVPETIFQNPHSPASSKFITV